MGPGSHRVDVSLSYLKPGNKHELNTDCYLSGWHKHRGGVGDIDPAYIIVWLLLLLFVTNDCVCLNRSCIITH